MKPIAPVLAFALSLGLPASAQAYGFADRLPSAQVNSAVFEVVSRGAQSAREYWCSAGAHARLQLGARNADRVYLARGRGPSATNPRRKSVQFTLSPAAAGIEPASPGLSLTVRRVGDNLSVGQAAAFCNSTPAGF